MRKFLCGVPTFACGGGDTIVDKRPMRTHDSPQEAFKCHARYLISQGYTRVGSKEFAAPNGGPIRVLTRPGKFGASVRMGKVGEQGASSKRRGTWVRQHGTGGGVIST